MNRTVTLPTADRGDVTLPEPSWCVGHPHHDPNTERANVAHTSPTVPLTFRGHTLSVASLVQYPLAEAAHAVPYASDLLFGRELNPVGLYEYAAVLDAYADRLRALADQLHGILFGEDQ